MGNCQDKSNKSRDGSSAPSGQPAKRSGRESMLDITGKSATQSKGGGAPRLANIFMSPVKIEENYVFPKFVKTDDEREFISRITKDNFIFESVGKEERTHLLDAFESYRAPKGEAIITEGEVGDYFYVIQSGKVAFTVDGERVGDAGSGRSFGDLALLYDCPRAATCVAVEACELWRVDQKTFRQILANGRVNGDKETIESLQKVSFLKDLSNEYLAKMAAAAEAKTFKTGDVIIKKGDPGKDFYIIKEGLCKVKDIEVGGQSYADQILKVGDFFGERAIVTDEPRVANIVATSDVETLCLSRDAFLNIIGPLETLMEKESDLRGLKAVPVFAASDVTAFEYSELVGRMEEVTFKAGADLYNEGKEWVPAIYFVRKGKVQITSKSNKKMEREATAGGFFGDVSFVFHKDPIETAIVTEDATFVVLTKDNCKAVLRTMTRLSQDPEKIKEEKAKKEKALVKLEELKKHRILGVGTFGKVWLVSREVGGQTQAYALKVQRKRQLLRHSQVEGVIREIKVMAGLDHPFILKLLNVYEDAATVMMLLQLVQGGELYSVMKKHNNMMLPERDSKFYAASILEGLHYMHYRNILYRDLKPENVLIDKDGYAVIVDLGFAKEVHGKTFTLCGTPWYIAPEVVLGRGHDKAADYWSWAILVHEMCTGDTPFQEHGVDQMTLFKGIVKGKFKISARASQNVEDLVRKILVTKPQYRLGNLSGATKDIKTHAWLKDVDFNKMAKKVFRAPWRPKVSDPLDVSAFDNWDHMAKEERERPLNREEQKQFAPLNEVKFN